MGQRLRHRQGKPAVNGWAAPTEPGATSLLYRVRNQGTGSETGIETGKEGLAQAIQETLDHNLKGY